MIKQMTVLSSTHKYPIYIGENIRKNIAKFLSKKYSALLIITDENVANLYLSDVINSLQNYRVSTKIIPSGESSKTIETYYALQSKALSIGLDRQSAIIALGGGVVGDIAGFVAATFMRGIDYIQVPTTILAHDSSVGAKVAINHELGKNLIGSFYAPRVVVYDVDTLKSLPTAEIRSGYAEIVKESLINNKELFHELMQTNLDCITKDLLNKHIYKGIKIKKAIVERDEKESNERMYLNLGHTFGHALEALQLYTGLLHGEAVAIGLLFALFVSEKTYNVGLPINLLYTWLQKNKFPLQINQLSSNQILTYIKQDKKSANCMINLILLQDIGEPVIKSFKEAEILYFINQFLNKLNGGFYD